MSTKMADRTQVQEELKPQTIEEANRIIEALKARITWKEQEKERLQSDRETLSEEIARREVADAISQQPYSEAEKKKAWNALNTIDMQIGQADLTLARLRERLDQAERDLAEIEIGEFLGMLPELCEQIHTETAQFKRLFDQVREKIPVIAELYKKYNAASSEYIQRYKALHRNVVAEGDQAVITEVSDRQADQSLPISCRPLPLEGSFWTFVYSIQNLISPDSIGFLDMTHEREAARAAASMPAQIQAQEEDFEEEPETVTGFSLDEDEDFGADAGEQLGS